MRSCESSRIPNHVQHLQVGATDANQGLYRCYQYKSSWTSMIPQRLGSFARNVRITKIGKQAISPFAGSLFCHFEFCKAFKSTRYGGNEQLERLRCRDNFD
jgi:hypothetical protein